jgi:hypothetical protein
LVVRSVAASCRAWCWQLEGASRIVSGAVKLFRCECGAQIFFDNTQCLACGRVLGFEPRSARMLALPAAGYRTCSNYVNEGVCNWVLAEETEGELCQACELNHVIPDLSQPENRQRWLEVEKAKRRLIYGLNRLGLPVLSKERDSERGLSFDIKQSVGEERVLTGHSDGLITLNVEEADAAEREKTRAALKERYRTLLGHFRHEIGHYFWDRLIKDAERLEPFRATFGDERADYAEALRQHYARQADDNYAESFISHYAAAHPWEDFAETFAHYQHMADTLETASQFGFAVADRGDDFALLMQEWYRLTVALNALNRSMGLPDAYPFAISETVASKLRFVHELIPSSGRSSNG